MSRNDYISTNGSLNLDTIFNNIDNNTSGLATMVTKGELFINVTDYGAKGDGITDDTLAIETALNFASGKGIVLFPKSTSFYPINKLISIPSNTHMVINGDIKMAITDNCFLLDNVSDVTIEGDGSIQNGGIYTNVTSNILIKDLKFLNCHLWAVNVTQSSNVLLDNLKITNCGSSCEFAMQSTNCWARNLVIENSADELFAFYGGVTDSGIVNSVLDGSTSGSGISVLNDSGQPQPCDNILIQGNICKNNHLAGVEVATGTGGVGKHNNIIICNNYLHHNHKYSAPMYTGGVGLSNVDNVSVHDNIIHDDGNESMASGICVEGTCKHISIDNNIIYNEGDNDTNSVGMGVFSEECEDVTFTNNKVYDSATVKTMTSALTLYPNKRCVVKNNNFNSTFFGNKIKYDTIGEDNIWKDNIGLNPKGALTSPTIPATNVPLINPFPYQVKIYIYGGTISNIVLNNLSIPLTSGLFILEPKESIMLSYSVIPSWAWIGN